MKCVGLVTEKVLWDLLLRSVNSHKVTRASGENKLGTAMTVGFPIWREKHSPEFSMRMSALWDVPRCFVKKVLLVTSICTWTLFPRNSQCTCKGFRVCQYQACLTQHFPIHVPQGLFLLGDTYGPLIRFIEDILGNTMSGGSLRGQNNSQMARRQNLHTFCKSNVAFNGCIFPLLETISTEIDNTVGQSSFLNDYGFFSLKVAK